MIDLSIVLIFILGLIALIDWKFKSVPSFFLTGILFVTLFLRSQNLVFGILASLLMLIIYDLDKERTGLADFKVVAIIGLMISSWSLFFTFTIVFMLFQVFYVFLFRKVIKYNDEIPFIPCLYAVYLALFIIGGFA